MIEGALKRAQKHNRSYCGKKQYGIKAQPDSVTSSSLKM